MEHFEPIEKDAPELYLLPLTRSRYGLPDEYGMALALFEEAKADYENGKAAEAGPKFLRVAHLLKAPARDTTYSASFAKMRVVAYEDAAMAFEQAGKHAELAKALNIALEEDPQNVPALHALLGK